MNVHKQNRQKRNLPHCSLDILSSRGAALLTALAVAGILGILGLAFMTRISDEQQSAGHWRQAIQAFYLAEAAVSQGVSFLRDDTIDEFPYSEKNIAFGNGKYSLTVMVEHLSNGDDGGGHDQETHGDDDDDHDSGHDQEMHGDDDHGGGHDQEMHGDDDDDHDSGHDQEMHGDDDDDHDGGHDQEMHGDDDDDHDGGHDQETHGDDDDDHDGGHDRDDDGDENHGGRTNAYSVELYTITGVGDVQGVKRSVEVVLKKDTFLRFARFVQSSSLSYASGAILKGDVWAGGDLRLNGSPIIFMQDVSVGGRIRNRYYGVFYAKARESVPPIELQTSVDLTYYRNLAQGELEGKGQGLYSTSSSTIDLNQFNLGGSSPTYAGASLGSDFNGVVYVTGDAYVSGELNGGSLTIIATDDVIITGQIHTGTEDSQYTQTNQPVVFNSAKGSVQTRIIDINSLIGTNTPVVRIRTAGRKWNKIKGELLEDDRVVSRTYLIRQPGSPDEQMATFANFDPSPDAHSYSVKLYYRSSGTGANPTWIRVYEGKPVNLGLVAKDMIYIASKTPRQLVIDAALLARDRTWNALGSSSSHPAGFDNSWRLIINGPIITRIGGSAGPWASGGVREYNYDTDIVDSPPPYFPVPLGGWRKVHWKEELPKDLS